MYSRKKMGSNILSKRTTVVLLSIFLFTAACYSQHLKYKFERLTTKEGLANSTVNCIIQNKTGFMWFGTYSGLSKFDGYTFTNFSNDPEDTNTISPGAIVYLLEDTDGKIWIANNGKVGLDRYDPKVDKFEHFKNNPDDTTSISSDLIYHVIQDKQNNIWICTNNALNLMVKENDKISFRRFYFTLASSTTARLHINKDGVILVFSNKLLYFDTEKLRFKDAGIDFGSQVYNSFAEDKDGNLYVGTLANGIMKLDYNPVSKTYARVSDFFPNPTPSNRSCVIFDNKGQLWIGTDTKGLFRYNTTDKELTQFVNSELDLHSLSDNSVYSLAVDKTGVLWIGTLNQGLNCFDLNQNKFFHYRTIPGDPTSLGGNQISAIHGTSENEVWVGSRGDGGVSRLIFDDKDRLQVIQYHNDPQNPNSIANNNVLCLVQGKDGDVWIGSGSTRLSRIIPQDPFSGKKEEILSYGISGWTFSIFEDSEGIIWGGTWGSGLWRLNKQTNEIISYRNDPANPTSLCDNVVWAIYEDSYHNIWIGGNQNGISVLTAEQKNKANPQFINFKYDKENPLSISNNCINAFLQDKNGTMWIATNAGIDYVVNSKRVIAKLSSSKNLQFKSFTTKNGLPSDGISGIVEDLNRNLWMSTSKGISFFNLKDSTFTNYFESDGLQSDEFLHNAYFVNSKGRLFFGGKNGVSAFYPTDITANPFMPQIVLTDLKIFNKSVKVGEEVNDDVILEKALTELKEIVLSYRNNVITIEFAALHYVQPQKNQYAYYLEGFEDDWNYVNGIRSATYTNLDPGKYVFRVKGSNNNGIWNDEGISLIIRVKAPWWKTWIFRIFAILVFGLIVFYAIRIRLKTMKREKELLQSKIEEGEHEIQLRKDEIEKQKQEMELQSRNEFEIRYLNTGISKFAEIIASKRSNIEELSYNLLSELVRYTGTNAGAIYLVNDLDAENILLSVSATYCFSSNLKENQKEISPEVGYIGTCYSTKKIIRLNDLPKDYLVLRSSLGEVSLRQCLFVPVINDTLCYGVIELASLSDIEQYKTEFITKLADNFASVIAIHNANQKTKEMLEQNKVQAEELMAQEEELRQNLEEMQATQELLKRQMEESKRANQNMLFEQSLTNTLLKNSREGIYFKDLKSRFIKASLSMKDIFKVNDIEEIYGKSDFDFFTNEHAQPAYEDEQNIIKTGIPIVDKIEKETHADGRITYVTTTKMPLTDQEEKIIGTFGISRNITTFIEMQQKYEQYEKEIKEKEAKIAELQEEIRKRKQL